MTHVVVCVDAGVLFDREVVVLAVTLMDLREGCCNCHLVERLACFAPRIFVWDTLNGILREEGGGLVRIVDGVNMVTLACKRPPVSRIGDGAQHRVLNATGWEPSFKGDLRWANLFSASPRG